MSLSTYDRRPCMQSYPRLAIYRVAQKVSHYQESLNRIKNEHKNFISVY